MIALQVNKILNYKKILYPAAKEAIIILLGAVIIAVVFNFLSPSGLPLFGFSSSELIKEQQAKIPSISLPEAHELYLKKKAVFVDARDPLSFQENHIAGAINIYPDEVIIHFANLKSLIAEDSIVITYCDGPQCPLSKETAYALLMQGIPVTKVFVDGWRLWLNAGYPTAKGAS